MKLHRIFFYLTILLLPTQLGYHFWPDWALVLGRRIDYLSPTLYLTDILIVCTLLCKFPALRFKIKHVALIFFFFINIFLSKNPYAGIYMMIKILEYYLFALYIFETKPKFETIRTVFSLAILYESIIAITQFLLQHSIGGIFWFLGERTFSIHTPGIARFDLCLPNVTGCFEVLRSYGTLPHPNVLGGFLAIGLILIKNTKLKIIGFTALVLTFSRTAFVVLILGMFLQKYQIKKIIFVVGIIISIVAFQLLKRLFPLSESIVVRSELNTAALSMFISSPLIGIGLGNFIPRLPDYLVEHSVYFLQPVHNIYLLILSELGVVSIFLLRFRFRYTIPILMLAMIGLVDHYPITLQSGQLFTTLILALSLPKQTNDIQSSHVQPNKTSGGIKHNKPDRRTNHYK